MISFKNGEYEGEVLRLSIHNKTDNMENNTTNSDSERYSMLAQIDAHQWFSRLSSKERNAAVVAHTDHKDYDSVYSPLVHPDIYKCWIGEVVKPWWEAYLKDPINWRTYAFNAWASYSESEICNVYLKEQEVKDEHLENIDLVPKEEPVSTVEDMIEAIMQKYSLNDLVQGLKDKGVIYYWELGVKTKEKELIQELRDALIEIVPTSTPAYSLKGEAYLQMIRQVQSAITKADNYLGGTKTENHE